MKKAIKLIAILNFGIFSLSLNIACGSIKLSKSTNYNGQTERYAKSKTEPTVWKRIDGQWVTTIDGQVVKKPTEHCRASFSALLYNDRRQLWEFTKPYKGRNSGHYLGEGKYMKNKNAIPKALAGTLDGIAIAKGTRVIIYSTENLKGNILLDQSGPALINNTYFKGGVSWLGTSYDSVLTKKFKGKLNQLFPPSCRKYSSSIMHNWRKGSFEIICED